MQIIKILLSALLCACSFVVGAQSTGTIRGTIKEEGGFPAIALTVKVQNTPLVTICDNEGNFEITNVQPGSYTLLVTGVGFTPLEHKVIVAAGKESVVKMTVVQNSVEMDVITVVGRSAVEDANRQAYNITAVDAKQLYNTTLDLAGALDRVSGIRVRESGGVGSNFNLSLNGFSGNHIRYFIDGIPMDGFGSSFQINNIPINAAERIEVYKGVVPIWLGSDALGGAINIITNDRARNYVDASYSYGSFNTHRSVINAAATSRSGLTVQISAFQNYSDNDYKVKVEASHIKTGAYYPMAWLKRFHDTYHNETLIGNVGVVKKKYADKLLFGITVGRNYKEIQTGARMKAVFGSWHRKGNILMPSFKYAKNDLIKGLDITLNANYNLGSEQNIDTMNVRFDWLGNSKKNPGPGGESSRSLYKYRNNNGLATAMFNYRMNNRQAIAVSNVFNTFNRKGSDALNPATVDPPRKTEKNVLGIGYTYSIEDSLSFSLFSKYITQKNVMRAEDANATTRKLGYGVVGSYFITPALQVKVSYELTNRMPEATEMFGDVENQEGNPNLLPEKSNNVNAGVSYSFAANRMHNFILNANAVYRRSDNFIYNRLNNNQSKLVAANREGVRTIGGDAEISYSYKSWLSIGATMTYQYIQNMQKYEPETPNGISAVYLDQMPNIPFLFGNGDISASFRDVGSKGNSLNVSYNSLYVHAFYLYWPSRGSEKFDIPTQLSHDINIVYSIKQGRYNFGFEARNITNTLMYDNFSLQKPGRAFYLNIRYFFTKNK